ncbi:uncharacterized protein [Prorops nasuta]|uniref:uncharacterized protein n=1 Tax=Prorops nasuta TaxID=863751 RepID=UPI0034CF1C8E
MTCVEEGFRLTGPPSECSLRSKARIDALFEDSRSICSSTLGGWYGAVSTVQSAPAEDVGAEEQKRVNSAVQARIEAMFASVEAEHGTPGECAAAILPVRYLGAAPVGGRVASVRGLQEPLRQLLERVEGSVRAELEVSRRGLTFRTEAYEKNNPFRRIAVWSALRLRCKRNGSGDFHHAFMPLVGDQDQSSVGEERHADLYRTMRGLKTQPEVYPPIFAVVMRRPGVARLLECHAFACEIEEDAVAAAATLYRALLADLDANRRRPRHANGVGCVSLASVASSVRDQSPSSRSCWNNLPVPSRPTAPHPVRPPRMKKTSVSSSITEDDSPKPQELQKLPRRKKKDSVVNAEDILEARAQRDSNKDQRKVQNQNQNQELTKQEEWQNSKNKLYTKCRLEMDKGPGRIYEKATNNYEKLPLKKSTVDSGQFFSMVESKENDLYEKTHGSYDLNKNEMQKRCDIYAEAKRPPIYDKVEKTANIANENIYEKSKKMGNREKLYEDRFRDAEKIYSLGQEDVYIKDNSKNDGQCAKSMQGDVYFSKGGKISTGRESELGRSSGTQRSQRSVEQSDTGRRLSRVLTMDKPKKKPEASSLAQNNSEYSQPRVRKRSRAGSEPPVSRSEAAAKIYQEGRLKRSQSDLDVDRGDPMTRVELPRRGSFLNTGSVRKPNNITGGTPLGFTELFDEFRNQEGLTSVDDILAAIIDPEGMSFNDLKPLYKEFLLKLAATLTQDELYQRSASIMRRRRRPQRRRSTRRPCLLSRAIKRSVSRLKGGPTEFTSVIFPARRLNDSFGSSSSCDARNGHRNRVLASRISRRKSSWRRNRNNFHTTSEDSDTCRRMSRNMIATANRSSSGYVSCSECSYDSESCTCVSADKCYCSLSRRVPLQSAPGNQVICNCDTDSCSESNKCYCARRPVQPTILEQLRQRGIVPAESTLSRGCSPERVRTSKASRGHSSSRSLEFLKILPPTACGSSDNLALDYDLFSPGRRSQQSSGSEKILVVSARDTQGRLVYVGGAERDKKYFSNGSGRSNGHHEALSIKKSAEIAAVFGQDSHRMYRRGSNASSLRSSISLEAGLGYLP